MPFKSDKQRKWYYANDKHFYDDYTGGNKLISEKTNPSKDIEIRKWKMIRQQYINKLMNYLSTGFTIVPHDKDILMKAENKLALLEGRKSLSFEKLKEKALR